MDVHGSAHGLSTSEALKQLHKETEEELYKYEKSLQSSSHLQLWKQCFLHHGCVPSVLHWPSVLILIISAILQIVAFASQQDARYRWLIVEAFVILMVLTLTIYFLHWDERLKAREILVKARLMLSKINNCAENAVWADNVYLTLNSPLSPCVTVQWAMRDGKLINLPSVLLATGDVVYLRPGQVVSAVCRQIKDFTGYTDLDADEYNLGDLYNPANPQDVRLTCSPQARPPLKALPYRVSQSPYLVEFRRIIRGARTRPTSVIDNERYDIYTVWIERRLLPVIFMAVLLTNALRLVFLGDQVGQWAEMLLALQVHAVLPLTALVFPTMWRLLDLWGEARVITAFHTASKCSLETTTDDSSEFESNSSLAEVSDLTLTLDVSEIWVNFKDIVKGTSEALPRTANVLHALGNVTSFCCVDKKGVLSWPNPTAEKVFFLTDRGTQSSGKSFHQSDESGEESDSDQGSDQSDLPAIPKDQCDFPGESSVQVLDLTQDAKNRYGLEFDDPSWRKYLSSLKPLGLDIMLNTCNLKTVEKYTQFGDHVTCASLKQEVSVPVINRRCFCEVASLIGFNREATDIFETQQVLGMYRQVPFGPLERDKGRRRCSIKSKMPMPNVFSVVVKEKTTGMSQLFSQGTADLLLDACSDYWNGSDLCHLTDSEKRKITDFYHRTSMSSYCTAFAYRPLNHTIGEEFDGVYIEVPEDSHTLFPRLRSPTPSRAWDTQSLDSRLRHVRDYMHGSTDSLMLGSSAISVHDTEGCFKEQCNQIFIGLITMQYQAKQSIVDLIEDLESACIRFVHFSKENELRSRVFSEKMGLEAGWNCHVSLLSEKQREADVVSKDNEGTPSHRDPSHSGSGSGHQSRYSSRQSTDSLPVRKAAGGGGGHQGASYRKDPLASGSLRGRRLSAPGAISLETSLVKFETTPSPVSGMSSVEGEERRHTVTARSQIPHSPSDPTDHIGCDLSPVTSGADGEGPGPEVPLLQNAAAAPAALHQPPDNEEFDFKAREKPASVAYVSENTDISEDDPLFPERISSLDSLPPSSFVTDNTDSVIGGLGLSNRAKLPKGIENIRPHIENVDNVPLLVSLFTDCTPKTTCEMLQILQEYGEVVCCFGSSVNFHNVGIFMQADCSFCVEPLYSQICMRREPMERTTCNSAPIPTDHVTGRAGPNATNHVIGRPVPTPMELAASLLSLPCSLDLGKTDNDSIIKFIALARHHCQQMRNTFLFYLTCQVSLTLLQLLAGVLLLPPVLSPHLLLWLVGVVTPLLSLTMMGNPLDLQIVKMAQGKNQNHVPKKSVVEFLLYYLVRYLPSLLVCLVCFAVTLHAFCKKVHSPGGAATGLNGMDQSPANTTSCHLLRGDLGYGRPGVWNGWHGDYTEGLVVAQNIVALQLVLYFVCGSVSFSHRLKQLWQRTPLNNKLWCVVAPVLLLCQLMYLAADTSVEQQLGGVRLGLADVPVITWAVACAWPLVLLPLMELFKRYETRSWVRYQKRARLDFGTKLGMNSPF